MRSAWEVANVVAAATTAVLVDLVQRVAERGDEGAADWIRTRRYRWPWRARSRSRATAAAGSSAE